MRIIKELMTLRYVIFICLLVHLCACGATKWYSVEEQPAEPIAYLSDGVYVLNDYIRSAIVTEIDGERVHQNTSNYYKINAGTHHVKVNCDEAKGNFNSNQLMGPARMLVFEAHTQRMYKASCLPYTHWWIEDLENGDVVAGHKPKLI